MSELHDHDELTSRLLTFVDGRIAPSFAIGHLITQMKYLDIAVEDYELASAEYQLAAARWRDFADPLYDGGEGNPDPFKDEELTTAFSRELALYSSVGLRLNYRADSAYGAGRRILDRLVVVVHELLPRTETDLGTSHASFKTLLARRCGELGIEVPEGLLEQVDDLNRRIKTVRDRLTEHLGSQMDMAVDLREQRSATSEVDRTPRGSDQARQEPRPDAGRARTP